MASDQTLLVSQKQSLFLPDLHELAAAIKEGLLRNFESVSVCVADCPDLRKPPFGLAGSGLCGRPTIIDVGGVPYLIPTPDLKRTYNFDVLAEVIGIESPFFIGAGAGACHILGVNSEMMANIKLNKNGKDNVGTRVAYVGKSDGRCHLQEQNNKEFCLLGNFLASEGKMKKVCHIKVKRRTGNENFVSSIRKAIILKYGTECIGLGGVFLIKQGKAKLHVMPAFSEDPLLSDCDVENWLKFYEMNSPLVCLSVMVSSDPGLDLRLEHTHCFSYHGEGGHYHYDTTPDDIEYEGYFALAEEIVRVDRPDITHQIGRD